MNWESKRVNSVPLTVKDQVVAINHPESICRGSDDAKDQVVGINHPESIYQCSDEACTR